MHLSFPDSVPYAADLVLLVNRRVIQVHDHEEGPIKSIDQVVQNEIMFTELPPPLIWFEKVRNGLLSQPA